MAQSLEDWLQTIASIHHSAIDLGLQRIQPLVDSLGLSRFDCPVIMVAGTNGKGSCVRYLESIYLHAGYRVGAYTSPHLLEFNERLRINNDNISDAELTAAFAQIQSVRGDMSLSFFEFTTLAILSILKNKALDVIILEVGLGGRLDAVNCVEPDVSIITSIDIDHVAWLGPDRESIGKEKAGIFREKKPAVCGDLNPPQSVLAAAKTMNVSLKCYQRDYFVGETDNDWHWSCATNEHHQLPIPKLALQNAATSLMALELLQDRLPVSYKSIQHGVAKAQLSGRFETVTCAGIPLILDVAHNPASVSLLAETLQSKPVRGKTLAVVAMLEDKPLKESLKAMLPIIDDWCVAELEEDIVRKADAIVLMNILKELGVKSCYNLGSVSEAMASALSKCSKEHDDRVVVFGSFHTVAQAKRYLTNNIAEVVL